MFGNPFDLRDDLKTENKSAPDPFGRLGVDDEPDTEIAEIKNPAELASSVGDSGQNSRRDVAKTEQLLGNAGTLDLKNTLTTSQSNIDFYTQRLKEITAQIGELEKQL